MYQPLGSAMYSDVAATIFVAEFELDQLPPAVFVKVTPPFSQAQISGAEFAFTKMIVFSEKSTPSPYSTVIVVSFPEAITTSFVSLRVPLAS